MAKVKKKSSVQAKPFAAHVVFNARGEVYRCVYGSTRLSAVYGYLNKERAREAVVKGDCFKPKDGPHVVLPVIVADSRYYKLVRKKN